MDPAAGTAGEEKYPISESNDIGTEPILTEYVFVCLRGGVKMKKGSSSRSAGS